MEHFPRSDNPDDYVTLPSMDNETQGDDAWRIARWKELQETGRISVPFGLSLDGQIKPYPSRLFVPPPIEQSTVRPYPLHLLPYPESLDGEGH